MSVYVSGTKSFSSKTKWNLEYQVNRNFSQKTKQKLEHKVRKIEL